MDESIYWGRLYSKRGQELEALRQKRLAEDPAYRDQVSGQADRSKRAEREAALKEKAAQAASRKLSAASGWHTETIEILHNGEPVQATCFSIGALASSLGIGISTARVWEKKGLLPETPYRSSRNDRLYTLDMVEGMRKQLARDGRIGPKSRKSRRDWSSPIVHKALFADGSTKMLQLYRLNVLASVLQKSVVWLKILEKAERIPRTPFALSSLQYRLYTAEMIEAVKAAFDTHKFMFRGGGDERHWRVLYDTIDIKWDALGITGARLLEGNENEDASAAEQHSTPPESDG